MLRTRQIAFIGLAALAGCRVGPTTYKIPISGGQMASVVFDHDAVVPAENEDFKIELAQYEVDPKTKLGTYRFGFLAKKGTPPRSVKVDDVTDDDALTWIEDATPQLKNRHWRWVSQPVPPDRAHLHWLFELESCIRVYRFTLVTADGRTLEMYEACSYPDYIKTYFRQQLGLEAPRPPLRSLILPRGSPLRPNSALADRCSSGSRNSSPFGSCHCRSASPCW